MRCIGIVAAGEYATRAGCCHNINSARRTKLIGMPLSSLMNSPMTIAAHGKHVGESLIAESFIAEVVNFACEPRLTHFADSASASEGRASKRGPLCSRVVGWFVTHSSRIVVRRSARTFVVLAGSTIDQDTSELPIRSIGALFEPVHVEAWRVLLLAFQAACVKTDLLVRFDIQPAHPLRTTTHSPSVGSGS